MRVLVAGIGNIFLGDDGFGVAVAERLRQESWPDGVAVSEFGVRGVHLAYELAGGAYDAAVLVDAVARGGEPGTLYAIEASADLDGAGDPMDAHNLTPAVVLAWLTRLGAQCRVVVVGCEPASLEESMELSPVVAGSVDGAVRLVRDVVSQLTGALPCA